MRKITRDAWLTAALFGLLILISVASAVQEARNQKAPPLASFSSDPEGAKALRLWLDELGYATTDQVDDVTRLPGDLDLVFTLEPHPGITEPEWDAIDRWVEAGGSFILAGDKLGSRLAMQHYEFSLTDLDEPVEDLSLQAPLLAGLPVSPTARLRASAWLNTSRSDYVTHLAAGSGPVLVSFPQGKGLVILSSASFPFSNAGLKEPGNPALVLNLVAAARGSRPGERGRVWFDEWRDGVRPAGEVVGVDRWLARTPAGRSLLYAALIVFLALLFQGRAFGRPARLAREINRRTPLEFITALANLNRRAGHRAEMLQLYRRDLKRRLGQRYRLDPSLPDDEWVLQLAQVRPGLQAEALAQLLERLRSPQVSEAEMVQLARQAAAWMEDLLDR